MSIICHAQDPLVLGVSRGASFGDEDEPECGFRLGWGGDLTGGFLFYLPLVTLGFHPVAVFGMLGLGLFYQFFLHVACPPSLGPLEWILNTPRHHHVHHASNGEYLDKNFGSVLIVFDRLFGTFAKAPKTRNSNSDWLASRRHEIRS